MFSRLKEELGLRIVKVRGLWRVSVHVALSLIAMLAVALSAMEIGMPSLMNSISAFKF